MTRQKGITTMAGYWIIDVQNLQVIAFAVENGGSRRIDRSQVLPDLPIALLQDAFQQTRQTNHGKVGAWLLAQFQSMPESGRDYETASRD